MIVSPNQSEINMRADPSPSNRSSTAITDLDVDALTHCASYLNLRDVSSLAMSCKYLNKVAYCDSIWQSLHRKEWPAVLPLSNQASSIREAYLSRHTSLHQFKYLDPLLNDLYIPGKPPHHLLFDKDNIIFSQGPSILSLQADLMDTLPCTLLGNHNAGVTCMRLFSSSEAYPHQSDSERDDSILITSSNDHFVRLWSKGGNRCFKGHNGPVLTLSDKLLGDDTAKLFASGGEDGTVRLWSIYSSGKRGQHALKATFHGHDKAVSLMSVAGHKTSLLVSIAKNGKVRVWDTMTASSSIRSSSCVGTTSVPLGPVGMKCHESLLYVAADSSVTALDLRTMQKAFTIAQQTKVHSLELLPTKSALCTGGTGRAMLWDVRRVSEPAVELDGHVGPIKYVFMDSFKIVTSGPDDPYVNVWEADTGKQTNSLIASFSDRPQTESGCSAIAVDGCRIVTASGVVVDQRTATLCIRDFKTATCYVSPDLSQESPSVSRFWDSNSGSGDSEEVDWQ